MIKASTQQIPLFELRTFLAPVLAIGLLALSALPYVFCATFSDFKIFDDEGTLMIAFHEILEGRILYRDVFGLYGPFYYLAITPVFGWLGVPLSHDAVRLISALFWLCCSIAFAALVWRLARSTIAAAFAFLTGLFLLKVFVHSPLHPQELSFLLIAILLHLLVGIEERPRPVALALVGAIVGGLLLTKINLAAFVILPLLLAALRCTHGHAALRAMHGIALALSLLMPVVLIAPLLHLEWAARYLVFASGTIFAALVVWSCSFVPTILTIRHWAFCAGGCAVALLVTLAATMAGGTTAFEVFHATVLQNLGLVRNWYLPAPVDGAALAVTAISVAYAVLYARSRIRATNRQAAIARVMRLKAGIGILGCASAALAAIVGTPWKVLPPLMFQFLVPFAWLLIVTDETSEHPRPLARGVLGLMGAFLVLYAFPVQGTQTTLASLLPAVMLSLLLSDALGHPDVRRLLKRPLSQAFGMAGPRGNMITVVFWASILTMLGSQTVSDVQRYRSLQTLDLSGTSLVRTDRGTVQLFHWVVGELTNCEAFYSIPSLPSLYFWTGQKPPTGMLINNTFGLLSAEQQRRAVSDLNRYEKLCILKFPRLLDLFDRGQLARRPPLWHYIDDNFTEVASRGPLHLLRRNADQGASGPPPTPGAERE